MQVSCDNERLLISVDGMLFSKGKHRFLYLYFKMHVSSSSWQATFPIGRVLHHPLTFLANNNFVDLKVPLQACLLNRLAVSVLTKQ